MAPRAAVWILAVGLLGCELPEPAGPKPTESAIAGGSAAKTRTTRDLVKVREPKPSEPAKPTGEETGALVGLRAAHDEARALVGVAPLSWSNTLGAYAQEWANQLAANDCKLAHRPSSPYGENLFWKTSTATASEVVAAWTAESANFDAASNSCSADVCGHYTQVVWSATTSLGCGVASCGQQQVWVCNYDPRGNIVGQKPY